MGSPDPGLALLHLTVAFASAVHAGSALEFLARASVEMTATERPVSGDGDMTIVDIDIPNHERSRLRTLLNGVHALVIEETAAIPALVA